uniref:Rho-GAP domain-containing protein n=1 Tax=Ditylenchus dipsaci TaxID=166011 RepID=A0A915DU28_9BILA
MDISKRIVSEDSLKVIEQWKDCQAYYHSLCVPRDSEANTQSRVKIPMGSTFDMRSPLSANKFWTKGRPIAECAHTFMPMRASIFTSNCSCQDCDLKIHEKCRLGAPLPCIPFVHTPQKLKQTSRPRLPDFCPDSQPQIPALLIRCVIALDKGFLNKEGLYRIPGNEAEWDPDIITGCIKKFLGSLREAIIPVSSFKEFARAADNENKEQLISLDDSREFGCCAWANNRRSIRIIKKPAVQYRGRTTDESEESRQQKNVLLQLLQLDNGFWVKYNEMPLELPPTVTSKKMSSQ